MAYSKLQANKARQQVRNDEMQTTAVLSGAGSAVLNLSLVASQISFQAQGSLLGTVSVSLDGITYVSAGSIAAANAIASYSSSLVRHVKVTWASGSGTLLVAAR